MPRPNGTSDIGPARAARLLAAWRDGTSQRKLARGEGCTQPRIAQLLRRAEAAEAAAGPVPPAPTLI
jgi:hypothetical protein